MKDGGPAFPIIIEEEHSGKTGAPIKSKIFTGMSLRDYFAAKAMEGCLASCPAGIGWHDPKGLPLAAWAKTSYRMADAMLEERERKPQC